MNSILEKPKQPVVSIINEGVWTTSLDVAERFDKRHNNVLRKIKALHDECPRGFTALNFERGVFIDTRGASRPMVTLTRDGFTLLVMGFSGTQALQWKIKYMDAFNVMENELLKRSQRCAHEFHHFLEITRGRMLKSSKGTAHDTVSPNTATLLDR